jgi:hypothetical protein
MLGVQGLVTSSPSVGGMTGFGVIDHPHQSGFGAVPGSGISF